ncbi:class D sortase [Alkalihalobacillus sp. 1P02AB]|uniref:class D sortase n=1 Tax=Alkalihalobacillus sp. 1P02AB TaxID=3132260 RepID=UPI0039A6987A
MKKGRLLIGLTFMLIGLVLVAIPFFSEWKQSKELDHLESALAIVQTGDGADLDQLTESSWSVEELEGIMELEIPSIDLKQYVLPETNEENLALSLTQIKPNQNPETDNFTIAGHRGYRGDRHFRQLPEVKVGEELLLHTNDKTYTYIVESITIIEANQVEVLDNNDYPEMTLITCTLSGEQRVAVKARLV